MNFKSFIYLVLNIFIFTLVCFADEGVYDLPKTDYKIEYYRIKGDYGFKREGKKFETVDRIWFLDLGQDHFDERKLAKYLNKKYKAVYLNGEVKEISLKLFHIEKDNLATGEIELKPVLGGKGNMYSSSPVFVFGISVNVTKYDYLFIDSSGEKIKIDENGSKKDLIAKSEEYLKNKDLKYSKYCLRKENLKKAEVYVKKIHNENWAKVIIPGCEVLFRNSKLLRTDQLHSGSETHGPLMIIGKVTIDKREYLIIYALMRHEHDSGTLLYELNEDGLGKAVMPELLPEHPYL